MRVVDPISGPGRSTVTEPPFRRVSESRPYNRKECTRPSMFLVCFVKQVCGVPPPTPGERRRVLVRKALPLLEGAPERPPEPNRYERYIVTEGLVEGPFTFREAVSGTSSSSKVLDVVRGLELPGVPTPRPTTAGKTRSVAT